MFAPEDFQQWFQRGLIGQEMHKQIRLGLQSINWYFLPFGVLALEYYFRALLS
jgi:hypothetical protein